MFLKVINIVSLYVCTLKYILYAVVDKGVYRGGFLGFQEAPFETRTISMITSLSKYTTINTV